MKMAINRKKRNPAPKAKPTVIKQPKLIEPKPVPVVVPVPIVEKLPELGIFLMFEDSKPMEYATNQSACYDIKAYLPDSKPINVWNLNNKKRSVYCKQVSHLETSCVILEPGDRALVPTGIQMDIPVGYSFRIHPRSGISLKEGIKLNNCEGIIDSDYFNQVYVSIHNSSGARVYIQNADRIAQGELQLTVKHRIRKMRKEPTQTTDRVGGLGHTGK